MPVLSQPAFADVQNVGLPRALMWYRYGTKWRTFFEELGRTVVVSGNSDRAIFEAGQKVSVDETCLASKLYLGHVIQLLDRPDVDAVFVPSLANKGYDHEYCVKHQAAPDLAANALYERQPRIMSFAIEGKKNKRAEEEAYLELGHQLGVSQRAASRAWKAARKAQEEHDDALAHAQESIVKATSKLPESERPLTILIAAHPYVAHDAYVSGPVLDALHDADATVLFSDEFDHERAFKRSYDFSSTMPWLVSREIVGSILELYPHIDGIVLMSAFPCGPDSMTNDAIARRIEGKPILTLTVDAQSGTAGIQTRVESFVDILTYQRKGGYLHE